MDLEVTTFVKNEHKIINAKLINKVLFFDDKRIKVNLILDKQQLTSNENYEKFNIILKDIENERKIYLLDLTWNQKQKILRMYNKHPIQNLKHIYLILSIIAILITILVPMRNWFGIYPFTKENVIEINSIYTHGSILEDTIDITIRNLSDNTAVINSIDFEIEKAFPISQILTNKYEIIPSTAKYQLQNIQKTISNVAKTNKKSIIHIPNSSFKIQRNDVDKLSIISQNIDLSHVIKYQIILNYNDKKHLRSEIQIHYFSQEDIFSLPKIENKKIKVPQFLSADTSSIKSVSQIQLQNKNSCNKLINIGHPSKKAIQLFKYYSK